MNYTLTVGLEIHAELATKTKLFCNSKNDTDEERPNVNICPICMGHPGVLPVINKKAIHHVLRVGVALGGELADYTEFDRKNYFYPDIPKGYQISQYKFPLVKGGSLVGVDITRVHLEEDTARSIHKSDHSLIDFNRAGVPLMELVTEPVIHDALTAGKFARELQLLLRTLGAAHANMEKGEMRVEANISVAPEIADQRESKSQINADTRRTGQRDSAFSPRQSAISTLGTKVEIKNLNSFRSVERAIAFEEKRQIALLEGGESVLQETRGWDENKQETYAQRVKETAADYRYFPDPDIPSFKLSQIKEFGREEIEKELPLLPWQKREKLISYGLKEEDAEMFLSHKTLGPLFDEIVDRADKKRDLVLRAANYLATDLAAHLDETTVLKFGAVEVLELMDLIERGDISSRGAKDILKKMYEEGGKPETIAKENNLIQKSDEGELNTLADKILSENKEAVSEYRAGKENALQFLVGQGMKESRGSANPEVLRKILKKKLT